MKRLFWMIFLLISMTVWSKDLDVITGYSPGIKFNYNNKVNTSEILQLNFIIRFDGYIIGSQYYKIKGREIYGLNIGTVMTNDTINTYFIDKIYTFSSIGFYDTSHSGTLFSDTNYPDIVIGVICDKNKILYGLTYSYFSGFKLQIGYSF